MNNLEMQYRGWVIAQRISSVLMTAVMVLLATFFMSMVSGVALMIVGYSTNWASAIQNSEVIGHFALFLLKVYIPIGLLGIGSHLILTNCSASPYYTETCCRHWYDAVQPRLIHTECYVGRVGPLSDSTPGTVIFRECRDAILSVIE